MSFGLSSSTLHLPRFSFLPVSIMGSGFEVIAFVPSLDVHCKQPNLPTSFRFSAWSRQIPFAQCPPAHATRKQQAGQAESTRQTFIEKIRGRNSLDILLNLQRTTEQARQDRLEKKPSPNLPCRPLTMPSYALAFIGVCCPTSKSPRAQPLS